MNAVTVRIPPLRDRGGDVMLLANFFLNRFNQEFGRNMRGFTEGASMALSAHSWPGNVRELENRLKRAVVMADRRLIEPADLELAQSEDQLPNLDLRAARLRAEREVIQAALARSSNTLSVAARLLGISRPTLYSLMQAHSIEVELGKVSDVADEIIALFKSTFFTLNIFFISIVFLKNLNPSSNNINSLCTLNLSLTP